MNQRKSWRLAIMFDAPDHDLVSLEAAFRKLGESVSVLAGNRPWRLGVAVADTTQVANTSHDLTAWRTVDGALEITFAGEEPPAIAETCLAIRPVLAQVAAAGSIETVVGRLYAMIPAKPGKVFLSLCFRRYPGTTADKFREWWSDLHAGIALSVLGPELLGYDQVHGDDDLTRQAAQALDVKFVSYDAYDNLTWEDAEAYARSTGDPAGMAVVAQDEEGRIDSTSRRFALMRVVRAAHGT